MAKVFLVCNEYGMPNLVAEVKTRWGEELRIRSSACGGVTKGEMVGTASQRGLSLPWLEPEVAALLDEREIEELLERVRRLES